MVKNTTGGNHHKGMARKMVNAEKSKRQLKLSEDELELYAQVTRPLGNNRCEVLCQDGIKRNCQIRGKFLGRNRRANDASTNTWILVGLREWASTHVENKDETKKEQCDLLYVYTDDEKERLRSACPRVNWQLFVDNDNGTKRATVALQQPTAERMVNMSAYDGGMNDIAFVDDEAYELEQKMANATKETVIRTEDDEIINVDDI